MSLEFNVVTKDTVLWDLNESNGKRRAPSVSPPRSAIISSTGKTQTPVSWHRKMRNLRT